MKTKKFLRVGDIVHVDVAGGHYAAIIKFYDEYVNVATITRKLGRHNGRFQIPNLQLGNDARGASYFYATTNWLEVDQVSGPYGHLDKAQAKELSKSVDLDCQSEYDFISRALQPVE